MKSMLLITLCLFFLTAWSRAEPKPLRVLYLTGGCCHDYNKQKNIVPGGITERANVDFEIVQEGGTGTDHQYPMLKEEGWWSAYDAVVYNMCFAHTTDAAYIDGITNAHKKHGLAAVALHCAFHSYHWKTSTDSWEELLGVTSPRHGKHAPITLKNLKPDHPVMKGWPSTWTTPKGELYHVKKTWPTATPLVSGSIDGGKSSHECVWVNTHGKAKVFGTTIGHHNETMQSKEYLDLLTKGLLWATGKLGKDGKPVAGYGK